MLIKLSVGWRIRIPVYCGENLTGDQSSSLDVVNRGGGVTLRSRGIGCRDENFVCKIVEFYAFRRCISGISFGDARSDGGFLDSGSETDSLKGYFNWNSTALYNLHCFLRSAGALEHD